MNEHEFRNALHASMTAVAQPPPMADHALLDAVRRDHRRRRTMWAGTGSAVAAVVIAVGVMVVVPSDGSRGNQVVGSAPPTTLPTTPSAEPRTDKQKLVAALKSVVPAGYESPDDLMGNGMMADAPLQNYQTIDTDSDHWAYRTHELHIPVTKDDGVGRLFVQVTGSGDPARGEACVAAAFTNWGVNSDTCTEVKVGDKRVGVVTDPDPGKRAGMFVQSASYLHDDGVIVTIAQAPYYADTSFPPLKTSLFTTEQLAELATDPRFHLD